MASPSHAAKKSGAKSGRKPGTFVSGDPRAGRGPRKGAPNAGRPPDAIRATCRLGFDERIATLQDIADDETKDPAVRIKAIETLAKYGLGTMTDATVHVEEIVPLVVTRRPS